MREQLPDLRPRLMDRHNQCDLPRHKSLRTTGRSVPKCDALQRREREVVLGAGMSVHARTYTDDVRI